MTLPHADDDESSCSARSFTQKDRLASATAALQSAYSQLDSQPHPDHFLEQLCKYAVSTIDGAQMAGMTVIGSDPTRRTIAATDHLVRTLDSIQFKVGAGPAVESMESATAVHAHSTEARSRWPQFAGATSITGIMSFLSVPLPGHDQPLGSLNLYSYHPRGFTAADVTVLQLFAVAAAFSLHSSRRLARSRARISDLELALESRGAIEQAKGIIMSTQRVDADHAFAILIQESQSSNIKLRTIAQQHIAAVFHPAHPAADIADTQQNKN